MQRNSALARIHISYAKPAGWLPQAMMRDAHVICTQSPETA
jgi:hypothetical protein